MAIDLSRHPCFNKEMRHTYGRVHLPVAPACNIQCRFCTRKYDCVNESRPGVTSAVITPKQALMYLGEIVQIMPQTAVVGIAGPGDPFANADKTMETLRLVRDHYPDMLLCVASNGMNVTPYVAELASLDVSHVTITVNAVDPEIGSGIYRWVRNGTRVMRGIDAAKRLLEHQLEAIRALKKHDIVVKVNTIIIPGVNDHHVESIARTMKELEVDILNCMKLIPAPGSDFEHLKEPSEESVEQIRKTAAQYIPQMTHCSRCRADAAGMIGASTNDMVAKLMQGCCTGAKTQQQKSVSNVAVATQERVLINQHLGNVKEFAIYTNSPDGPLFVERRAAPMPGGGDTRWKDLAATLHDCHTILVQHAGPRPREILSDEGIEVIVLEGVIEIALREIFAGRPVPRYMTSNTHKKCGSGCGGSGGGCGA